MSRPTSGSASNHCRRRPSRTGRCSSWTTPLPTTTPAAVQRYLGDPRIRYLRNEQNWGPGATRNRALDAAQGEWIAIVDADDWIAPERLEKLARFAEAQSVEMVADLQVYRTEWGGVYQVSWATYAKPPKAPRCYTLEQVITAHPSFKPLIRRAFLDAKQIRYPTTIRIGEDYAFYMEDASQGGALRAAA
jgi:succinoglycan biosynthesis protein ExoO